MNHPIQSVFVQIATSHWLRLECATRSRIPIGLSSLIDAEQVVNDSIDEWMTRASETMCNEAMEPMDLDALVGLLMFILKCHTTDAIRKEIAWKRGGRTINSGEEILDRCKDPNCVACTSAMEFEEMLVSVEQHLDAMQRSVLRLRLDGYTEFEIGERLQLSISAVKGIRRSIASIAKAMMPDAYPKSKEQRAKRQEARGKRQEKIVSKNGNFPNGDRAVYG
jgi:hypothetical protein